MASLNKMMVIGNVGKAPEIKTFGEHRVAKFSVAVSKKVKGENQTTWINVSVWGKLSEIVEKYVTKGSQIYLEGELNIRTYEKDGVQKLSVELNANQLVLLGKAGDKPAAKETVEQKPEEPVCDEDVPF